MPHSLAAALRADPPRCRTDVPVIDELPCLIVSCELAEQLGGDAVAQVVERVRHAVAGGVLEHAVDGN
jgi:hypothetical protein